MFQPGHKTVIRRADSPMQIRGSETELAAALLPALQKNGRFIVGRAVIRPFRKVHFQLDFGRICGRRMRLHRKTVTEAIRTAIQRTVELRQHGQLAQNLTTSQRFEAAIAYERLGKIGQSAPGALIAVVDAHLKKHPLGGNSRTLLDVINELVKRKKDRGRCARYTEDLGLKLRNFEKAFPGRSVSSITTEEIEAFLEPKQWKPVTVHSYVSAYKVLFNHALKRGYCTENPCDRLELPEKEKREPVILSLAQVRQMMEIAERPGFEDCRAWCSVGTFAGIRPEEIQRLDWSQVDFANGAITILGPNAKSRARRIVEMSPNLVAWLRPIAKESGPFLAAQVGALRKQMRTAMGLERWPHDVMRHSFGSYHFAKWRNESLTRNQMGHSDDGRMFFNHYRALVPPADAVAFWEVFPRAAAQEAAA